MKKNEWLHDPNWMAYRVLRADRVATDAKPALPKQMSNVLARSFPNMVKALFRGYRATYHVLPDTRGGEKRFGRIQRP